MAKISVSDAIRIIPREAEFLNRKSGLKGEIFYDRDQNSLRLYDGSQTGGISLAKTDLTNISNAVFLAKANSAGFSGGVQAGVSGKLAYYPATGSQVNDLTELEWTANTSTLNLTGTIQVSGQKNRIRFHWDTLADLNSEVSPVDYHGMVAHVHSTGKLYYAHAGAWVPVASESSLPNAFQLEAGSGITITSSNDSTVDIYTISSVANTGSVTFAGTVIDSTDSSAISFTPSVVFDSDITVGTDIVFSDGTRQSSSAEGVPGPAGPPGPQGASGAGTGDVLSAGGGYVDNAIIRYDGTTGTIIQNSSATISDAGLLTATNFSGGGALITALNATQLTTGTVPDARFPATLPAASGVNLTSLNATNLGNGTVPVLRLGTSGTRDATTYLRGDNTWAVVAGGGSSDSFATIAVTGQSNVVADSATDTLTLAGAGSVTITTNAGTDTITITGAGATTLDGLSDVVITSASNGQVLKYNGSNWINDTDATSAGGSNSFETIAVAGQSNVMADSATDTLTLAAGSGISITTNAGTDTVTITSTVSSGATAFTGLTDAGGNTVDKFYMPAITMLSVTNNGASAYRFDQYGTTDDPTIYAINGTTIAFNLSVAGHPFLIQDGTGTNYNTGLVHVTTAGTVSTGSSAQGQTSGTLYWKIPDTVSGGYRYQCSIHVGMVGTISVKNFGSI